MQSCLICFNEIIPRGIYSFFFKPKICYACFKKLKRKPHIKKVNNYKVYSLYPYQDNIVSLIYQLKGCNDYALAPAFLSYDWIFLKILFFDYIIIPVPSFIDHDKIRGFNHVEAIFSFLNLPIKILFKTKDYKQASLLKKEREVESLNIDIIYDKTLKNKKLLLVDDVITTGSTIKRCLSLLKTLNPKSVKIITIAYTLSNNKKI